MPVSFSQQVAEHALHQMGGDPGVAKVTLRTFTETDAGKNIIRTENAQALFERLGM
jgi:hypothetical protein